MRCFGTGFEEDQAVLPGESLSFFRAHLPTGVLVTFVTNQHDCSVGIAILPNFF